VVLPPIPKYARRNHAASTPISQQLIPASGSHSYHNAHSQYTPTQYTPTQYAPSQVGTGAGLGAPSLPLSQQPLPSGSQVGSGLNFFVRVCVYVCVCVCAWTRDNA